MATAPIRYHKAIRPDGTSFNDPTFRWVPEKGDPAGITVTHPHAHKDDASGYLSVAAVPTDCTGMGWPARHLVVEPVDGFEVFTPDATSLPNKRAAHAWRVVEERPAAELLGPGGADVMALIESFKGSTAEQWSKVSAARSAAWYAARSAARDAAWSAARDAAGDAARSAAWYAAGDAAGHAAWYAAEALTLRDLVGTVSGWDAAAYDILTAPLRAGGFPIPEAPKGK